MKRGARSADAADANSSDFADALAGAQKKAEPKPVENDGPDAKKSAATAPSKKGKRVEEQPRETDEAPAEASTVEETVEAAPESDQDELTAREDSPEVSEEADDADAHELPKVNADLSAIANAPIAGPQPPAAVQTTGIDAAAQTSGAMPICPMPKPQIPQARTTAAATEPADGETNILDESGDTTGIELEGLDDLLDEPVAEGDVDPGDVPAPSGKAPVTAAKHPTVAPLFSDETPEAAAADVPKENSNTPQALPVISSESSVADDVRAAANDVGPAPVTSAHADATVTVPLAHAQSVPAKPQAAPASPNAPAPLPPQAQFVEANHPKIVTAMHADLLPHGGTMQIRLDPPELGALQVMVHMQDGVMTASFHTSNDDATKLLSHSLSQLKQVLESQGVSVEKLQVQQSPRDQHAGNDEQRNQPRDQQDDAHRHEQQRKEMLRRMWRKLSIGSDPLDLVA